MDSKDLEVTTSSRHWLLCWTCRGGPVVDVVMLGVACCDGDDATDWKICIGRASKNSCAMIKGAELGSIRISPRTEIVSISQTFRYKTEVFTPHNLQAI